MGEKIKQITKDTVLPLGLVITLFGTMFAGAVWLGRIAQAVEQIQEQKSPTRDEFEKLSGSITYIERNMITKGDLGIKVKEQ